MKALSIRQPWAWLIVNGHKDIENRSWPTYRRGDILIHASKGMTKAEYEDVADMLAWQPGIYEQKIQLPAFDALERGGIVGKATITDSLTASSSPWFFGPHGFLLRNIQALPFAPLKGALGLFDVPDELFARPATEQNKALQRCAADRDGDCVHAQCPQLRDGEPKKSGRHCPLDVEQNKEKP